MVRIVRVQGCIAKRQRGAIDMDKQRLAMNFAYDTMQ